MKDKTKLKHIKNLTVNCAKSVISIDKGHEDDLYAQCLLFIIYHLCNEIMEVCLDD